MEHLSELEAGSIKGADVYKRQATLSAYAFLE